MTRNPCFFCNFALCKRLNRPAIVKKTVICHIERMRDISISFFKIPHVKSSG